MITDNDIQQAANSYMVCYGTGNDMTAFAAGAKWALEEEKRRANEAICEALKGQPGNMIYRGKPEGDALHEIIRLNGKWVEVRESKEEGDTLPKHH